MSSTPHILIIEDEQAIAELIDYNLQSAGFATSIANNGESAFDSLAQNLPDMLVVDWMLPDTSGIDIINEIRSSEQTASLPIIMLTARGEENDRLTGLEAGADDYMIKPFSPKELIARINAVLRRARPSIVTPTLSFAGIEAQIASQTARYNNRHIAMGPTEFNLLVYLIEHPERINTRENLLDSIWGINADVEIRTVDATIKRLRHALSNTHEGLGNLIQTKRGLGYSISEKSDEY